MWRFVNCLERNVSKILGLSDHWRATRFFFDPTSFWSAAGVSLTETSRPNETQNLQTTLVTIARPVALGLDDDGSIPYMIWCSGRNLSPRVRSVSRVSLRVALGSWYGGDGPAARLVRALAGTIGTFLPARDVPLAGVFLLALDLLLATAFAIVVLFTNEK